MIDECGGGCLPLGVADSFNIPESIVAEDGSSEDVVLTTEIKIIIALLFLVGFGFSLYTMSLLGGVVWAVSFGFILEILGVFDNFKTEVRNIKKPGGYENIE